MKTSFAFNRKRHARAFKIRSQNKEDFSGNTSSFADWLPSRMGKTCGGFERHVLSILCIHFFIAYLLGG